MRSKILLSIALLTLPVAMAATPKGDAKAGKATYAANCSACHGPVAAGVKGLGPKLSGEVAGWKPALFERALYKGIDDAGVKLKPPMPNFTGKLKPNQIADIQAYLKTLK